MAAIPSENSYTLTNTGTMIISAGISRKAASEFNRGCHRGAVIAHSGLRPGLDSPGFF
jgi:hypothetical protein